MFATAFHTSRHYILFTAMACLCVLLGGPSYAAGADSLFIAGATYYEPGVSGPGWAWTDACHLELNGYAGEAIGADDDLVVTLVGQNSVVETHAPDADISMSGMEVWGNLTLCGPGSLTATGSQCGIHVAQALVVDGCTVDARADGAGVLDQTVAGIAAGSLTVRGGGRVAAAGAGSDTGLRLYGVRLLDEGFGADAASKTLAVDASWLDATGMDAGVACNRGSLVAAHFMSPAGGAFGAGGVVDAGGAVAPHVVIEPDGATRYGTGEGSCGEVRGHAAQDNGQQDNSQQDDQAQIHYVNNTGASQDRRQLLDSCLLNAIPAGYSASERRISLLMQCDALGCGSTMTFGMLYELSHVLEKELGRKVDIITNPPERMRPAFRKSIEQDEVLVYEAL